MNRYKGMISGILLCIAVAAVGCGLSSGKVRESGNKKSQDTEKADDGGQEENDTQSITSRQASRDLFAMDTYMKVDAYGERAEEAVDAAVREIERLDALLSTGEESSEVSKINKNGGGTLSTDTAYLMEWSLELYKDTEGAFDIAVYPIMQEWGFADGEYKVPSEEKLQALLEIADASGIHYNEETREAVFEKEGMAIDFGGIAKGYTSSKIKDIYREYEIESGLINLGGNVQAVGGKTDGSSWKVAIQDPDGGEEYLGILEVRDKAVITSGGYERYFEQDGITYHHIIDPSNGYPAQNGLTSVTIISGDGTLADGLSTSLFIMGLDKAAEYWKNHRELFDAILLTDTGELYVTEGISDDFTSDLKMQVIE